MDCLSLFEHSSGNKSLHTANAVQLFTYNQIYGLHFWSEAALLQHDSQFKDINNAFYLMTNIYHSHSTQWQLFAEQGDVHLCESSAEFLLEPWLLMQVAWHPAVYYQWLVAALAEVLKAKQQLAEFNWWPVPRDLFSVVGKLLSQVETLHRRLFQGFRLINWLSNEYEDEDSGSGFETNCHSVLRIINLVILPSLPAIAFLVGDNFNNI